MDTNELINCLYGLESAFMDQGGPKPTIEWINDQEIVGRGVLLGRELKFEITFKEQQ